MRSFFAALAYGLIIAVAWTNFSECAAPARDGSVEWKQEFEDICSRTDNAMSLTVDELKQLIDRCDALQPLIEKLGETQKKVYLKKLQSCKNLYLFVIQYREQNRGKP